MGIATRNTNLNKVPLGEDAQSWVLSSDGAVRHNGEEKHKISDVPQEGDILVSHTYKCYSIFLKQQLHHCKSRNITPTI